MKNTSPFLLSLILLAGWLSSRSGNKIALIAADQENNGTANKNEPSKKSNLFFIEVTAERIFIFLNLLLKFSLRATRETVKIS